MKKPKKQKRTNKAPHIQPSAQFASSYTAAREDEERFTTTQRGNRRKKQKNLKKGEH